MGFIMKPQSYEIQKLSSDSRHNQTSREINEESYKIKS